MLKAPTPTRLTGRSARWLAGVLVVALLPISVIGHVTTAGAGELPPGGTFIDDDGSAHEGYIEAIAAAGITSGCNPPRNDMYCPGDDVTRGQMATLLANSLGLAPSDDDGPFTDHLDSVHRLNINAIRIAGITQGCNPPQDDMYCPGGLVTRAQMATFLAKALGLPPSDDDGRFIDHRDSVHRQSINAIRIAGITQGCNPPANDRFCPAELVTRAQMASFLGRALGLEPMVPPPRPPSQAPPGVSISGGQWLVDGRVTNSGSRAAGLLVNLRAVQGIFDDENPATRDRWAYPNGSGSGSWSAASAERNVSEFLTAMNDWAAAGVDAFTLSLQGGNPNADDGTGPTDGSRAEVVSAFRADGSLKPDWKERLRRVLDEADRLGMVVILDLFYKHQSDELRDEAAVLDATEAVLDFVWGEHDYDKIVFEVANEVTTSAPGPPDGYTHAILTMGRVDEVFEHMHAYAASRYPGKNLYVSASIAAAFSPSSVPSSYFNGADFILWHGNSIDMATQHSYIDAIRRQTTKPIVWNEDNNGERGRCPNRTTAAMDSKGTSTIGRGVSWGFHWKGCNDYQRGYQAMPVNWGNDNADPFKARFLDWTSALTAP